MNRAERRRLGIKQKPAVVQMKREDVQNIKKQATADSMKVAMTLMLAIPLQVMREHYGWGKKRLADLGEHLIDTFEQFEKSDLTTTEYKKMIYECCGISFEVEE